MQGTNSLGIGRRGTLSCKMKCVCSWGHICFKSKIQFPAYFTKLNAQNEKDTNAPWFCVNHVFWKPDPIFRKGFQRTTWFPYLLFVSVKQGIGWLCILSISKNGLELLTLLPPHPRCGHRRVSLLLASSLLLTCGTFILLTFSLSQKKKGVVFF